MTTPDPAALIAEAQASTTPIIAAEDRRYCPAFHCGENIAVGPHRRGCLIPLVERLALALTETQAALLASETLVTAQQGQLAEIRDALRRELGLHRVAEDELATSEAARQAAEQVAERMSEGLGRERQRCQDTYAAQAKVQAERAALRQELNQLTQEFADMSFSRDSLRARLTLTEAEQRVVAELRARTETWYDVLAILDRLTGGVESA